MTKTPFLSIVIPAFNEERTIENTVVKLIDYLKEKNYSSEIIVVDDGSTDSTKSKIEKILGRYRNLRLLKNRKNTGKGSAIRRGVMEASGQFILTTDADMSTPIEELDKLFLWLNKGYDIAIGSRALPASDIILPQTWYRQTMGKFFNLLVRLFLGLPFHDTQCGFKLFKGDVVKLLFGRQRINGFAFDAEILYLARLKRIKVKEVPVVWKNYAPSKVHPLKGAISMFTELITIRLAAWRGMYR